MEKDIKTRLKELVEAIEERVFISKEEIKDELLGLLRRLEWDDWKD